MTDNGCISPELLNVRAESAAISANLVGRIAASINNDRREHIKEIDPLIFAPAIERYILTGAASARVNIWKAWQ